jgi:hypothetical protein
MSGNHAKAVSDASKFIGVKLTARLGDRCVLGSGYDLSDRGLHSFETDGNGKFECPFCQRYVVLSNRFSTRLATHNKPQKTGSLTQ